MAALTGRTNAKHVKVFLDNSSGTLTDISCYVNTIGTVGKTYASQDVTAFCDGAVNFVIGQPTAQLQIGGPFDTVSHAQMIAINGASVPLSLDIRVGVRADWEAGAPQFGIT